MTSAIPTNAALVAWQERRTLDHWRAADDVLRRTTDAEAKGVHERVVAAALPALRQLGSVDELVAHWRAHRYRRLSDAGDPPEGSVEAWLREASRAAGDARPVDEELVAGAALWRRARELMEHVRGFEP